MAFPLHKLRHQVSHTPVAVQVWGYTWSYDKEMVRCRMSYQIAPGYMSSPFIAHTDQQSAKLNICPKLCIYGQLTTSLSQAHQYLLDWREGCPCLTHMTTGTYVRHGHTSQTSWEAEMQGEGGRTRLGGIYAAEEEACFSRYLGAAVANRPGQATCIRSIVHVALQACVRNY